MGYSITAAKAECLASSVRFIKCHCSGIKRPVSHLVPFPSSRGLRPFSFASGCSVCAGLSASILSDSAHSRLQLSCPGYPGFVCFKKFDLILRKQISFFLAVCSTTSTCVSTELLPSGSSVSCRFSSCQPKPLGNNPPAPWSQCLGSKLPQACSASPLSAFWDLIMAWCDCKLFCVPTFRVARTDVDVCQRLAHGRIEEASLCSEFRWLI